MRDICQEGLEFIPLGSEFKMGIHLCPIVQDGVETLYLEDIDFDCVFSANPIKKIVLNKSQLIKVDKENYVATLDSKKLGEGVVRCMLRTEIPDAHFMGGRMKKWIELFSNVYIYGKKY